MAAIGCAAEESRCHRPVEVRSELELRHCTVSHPYWLSRVDDLEPRQCEPVRLQKMCRRVDVVHPGHVWDAGEVVCVKDVA
jgi:hypothetical protein